MKRIDKKSTEEAATTMATVSLPDDVLREILDRVDDVAVLFRCGTVCKRWRCLLADQSFFRRRWPGQGQDACHSFLGFIAKDKRDGRREGVNGLVIPAPRSPLGPGCRALRSFMSARHAVLLDGAVPLASRHGLLLLRLADPSSDRTVLRMAVCNLLANTCAVLPSLKLASAGYDIDHDHEWCGYAILTDVDCHRRHGQPQPLMSNSSLYEVLVIGSSHENKQTGYNDYSLHKLSPRKATTWRTYASCLRIGGAHTTNGDGLFSDAMVRGGVAHWLFHGRWFYLVTFNIQTGHISYTRLHLPVNYRGLGFPCFTTTLLALDDEHSLSLLWTQITAGRQQLDILVQKPVLYCVGSNSDLLYTDTIQLKNPGEDESEESELYILGERCGTALVKDSRHHVYTVELKTGTMEEVAEWPARGCGIIPWESMPLELDWPTFFSCRLGIRV